MEATLTLAARALTGSGQSGNFSLEATYLTFNLSQKFDNLTNFLTILDSHDALSANALPDYVGGAMFANDYEFILYRYLWFLSSFCRFDLIPLF